MLSGDELKTHPNCGLNDWFQAGNLNFCTTGTDPLQTPILQNWSAVCSRSVTQREGVPLNSVVQRLKSVTSKLGAPGLGLLQSFTILSTKPHSLPPAHFTGTPWKPA